jgi:hypothetical protein
VEYAKAAPDGIPKPQRRRQMQRSMLVAAIMCRHRNHQITDADLGVD